MGSDRLLPRERRALSFGDSGFSHLKKIWIGKQLLVRCEDRGFGRLTFSMELSSQSGEVSLCGFNRGGEVSALGIHACARLGNRDLRAANLENFADRQPSRR